MKLVILLSLFLFSSCGTNTQPNSLNDFEPKVIHFNDFSVEITSELTLEPGETTADHLMPNKNQKMTLNQQIDGKAMNVTSEASADEHFQVPQPELTVKDPEVEGKWECASINPFLTSQVTIFERHTQSSSGKGSLYWPDGSIFFQNANATGRGTLRWPTGAKIVYIVKSTNNGLFEWPSGQDLLSQANSTRGGVIYRSSGEIWRDKKGRVFGGNADHYKDEKVEIIAQLVEQATFFAKAIVTIDAMRHVKLEITGVNKQTLKNGGADIAVKAEECNWHIK